MDSRLCIRAFNFSRAVNYLRNIESPYLMPSRVKAALRRMYDEPMFDVPENMVQQSETMMYIMNEAAYHKVGSMAHSFVIVVLLEYLLMILKNFHGKDSDIESHPEYAQVLMGTTKKFHKQANEALEKPRNIVFTRLMKEIIKLSAEIDELFRAKTQEEYAKAKVAAMMKEIKWELIETTWHPSRIQWWMDEEDKKEIFEFFG